MKHVAATYSSIWDDGVELSSSAKLDLETGKIIDIETVEVDGLSFCNSQSISILFGGLTKVYDVVEDDDGDYAVSSEDLEEIKKMVNITPLKMSYERWVEVYKPIPNHYVSDAPYNGCMFETYGEELDYASLDSVQKSVWTLVENDGKIEIVYGFQKVNRIGYFVTANIPLNPNIVIEIENDMATQRVHSLLKVVEDILRGHITSEPLDGDEVDDVIDEFKDAINQHEGNEQKLQKFECAECGVFYWVEDRDEFECPNCQEKE